jgi:hypothetical protein
MKGKDKAETANGKALRRWESPRLDRVGDLAEVLKGAHDSGKTTAPTGDMGEPNQKPPGQG